MGRSKENFQIYQINEAAQASGVTAKMIRHYEEIGVIPEPDRTDAGYRIYRDRDIHTLVFVKKARDLGFSTKAIQKLVGLWKNQSRPSKEVKKLALDHIDEMELKIRELKAMVKTLKTLSQHCQGDDRPDCPIINELSSPQSKSKSQK
jgi:MerR family copper efflux transcriptional regulator